MDAPETRTAVETADAPIGKILAAIDASPELRDRTSLFLTTDHGMAPVTHLVNAERILSAHDVAGRVTATGTTAFVYLDDAATLEQPAQNLSGYQEFEVLRRDALPAYAHLGSSPPVGDLILSAKPPYFIEDSSAWPWYFRRLAWVGPEILPTSALKATHGYPPAAQRMSGILYTWGAAIAPNRHVARVDAIDLHPNRHARAPAAPGNPIDGRVRYELLH